MNIQKYPVDEVVRRLETLSRDELVRLYNKTHPDIKLHAWPGNAGPLINRIVAFYIKSLEVAGDD